MASAKKPIDPKRLWMSIGILLLGLIVAYVAMVSLTQPVRYNDIKAGDVAQMTVTATKEVVDEIETERRRQEERDKVQPLREIDATVTTAVMGRVDELFALIEAGREDFAAYRKTKVDNSLIANPEMPLSTEDVKPDVSRIARLRDEMVPILDPDTEVVDSNENASKIPDAQITALLTASATEYDAFESVLRGMISAAFEDGLLESEIESAVTQLRYRLSTEMYGVSFSLQAFANTVFAHMIIANEFVNEELTEQKRQEAEDAVEPVTYKKGQNIVREGEEISENQVQMLEQLGLLEESNRVDLPLYVGMAIVVLMIGAAMFLCLLDTDLDDAMRPRSALLMMTALIVELIAALAVREISAYLMPMHFAIMVIAVLISPRVALSMNLLIGVAVGVFASGTDGVFSASMIELLIVSQVGGVIAAVSLRRAQRRTSLLLTGLYTALANAAVMVGIGLTTNLNLQTTFINAGLVAVGALVSAILAVGCLPLLESAFSIMTQQKLLELSNPNQPLLRQLQLEAPGTYHHALLVANLAEAAADAVGANALLCRVGAYYHDIGKVKRPLYFKENQMDDVNPHDTMLPQVSAAILSEHVRDGRIMAEKAKLPRAIVDIIRQHHGTTTMAYFLYRAQKMAEEEGGEKVSPEDYRYDGPTPQTKESAIIFLADSVEAAVRSLKDHTTESMQGMIKKLINERMQDGQLADVPLMLSDFHKIEIAFMRVLSGIYHTRVEYPGQLEKQQKDVAKP